MLTRIYRRDPLGFTLVCIAAYVLAMGLGNGLSERLGVNLYVKRDDFSGMSLFGGNKIRKLEYLLGDAKEKGCDTVFTYGATQSNHAMQTATACRRLGLEPILYLNAYVQPDENDVREGIVASKIAAHAADIALGLPGARDRDNAMADARHKLDWPAQFALALDPEKAERFYNQVPPTERHTCSMCGKMCAVRTTNMILEGKEVKLCSEKGAC